MIVFLNGEWLHAEEARIPISDRGFLYSDGVFETARLHQGKYFRLRQHLERLQQSARTLMLELPALPALEDLAHGLAQRNDVTEASLRITFTRGTGTQPTLLGTITPMPAGWQEQAAQGWSLVTARTLRPSPRSVPAQLKSLGRIYALLAAQEGRAAGADDVLLLTANEEIAEGPTWNFFWRTGRKIRTAALDGGILEGVTRRIILNIARERGFEVEEGLWPRAELDRADEAFATMTSRGVVPIRSLDGRPLPSTDCAVDFQVRYWRLVADELRAS